MALWLPLAAAIGAAVSHTDAGLALQEMAVNENSTEVIVLALTNDAVLAGSVYATVDEVDYRVAGATAELVFCLGA